MSNLAFVAAGSLGVYLAWRQHVELRFPATFFGVIVVGLGSAMFHATLQHVYVTVAHRH